MFETTRLKLTGWYLLIIMAISISFSMVIYFGSTREFDRILRVQEYRNEHPELQPRIIIRAPWEADVITLPPSPDPQLIEQARLRVLESLFAVNLIILILSALAGYFLAGRTLRPIKKMVDEQNMFITDASHELSTPLTALKTSIEVNLRDKNLTMQKAKNALVSNLEEVDNLQALSDELIQIAQFQKPNGNFVFENVSVPELIDSAVQKIKPMALKKKIKIEIETTKFKIKGNGRSLLEVLIILLDNAIKYSPEKRTVKISAKKIDSKAKIIVADEGMGIGKDDLPYIFNRFYRADKSRTKQVAKGYGLGLSIAKRVIDLHHGSIEVESKIKAGSKFIITLPVA